MSKNINVNPDHYKVAGRERQGEDIVQSEHRQKYAGNVQHDLAARAEQRNRSLEEMRKRREERSGEDGAARATQALGTKTTSARKAKKAVARRPKEALPKRPRAVPAGAVSKPAGSAGRKRSAAPARKK